MTAMSDEELQTMLNLAEGEVERLRSLGWTRQDFARALREELLEDEEPLSREQAILEDLDSAAHRLRLKVAMRNIAEDDAPKWDGVTPTCPHCWEAFKTWSLAKLHVKRCVLGKNPRGRTDT